MGHFFDKTSRERREQRQTTDGNFDWMKALKAPIQNKIIAEYGREKTQQVAIFSLDQTRNKCYCTHSNHTCKWLSDSYLQMAQSPSDNDKHDQEMMTTYRSNVSYIMYAAVHSWGVAVAVALGIEELHLPKNKHMRTC
jgi:hypothetical protein